MGGLLKKMANFGEENGVNQIVIRPSPISDGWDFWHVSQWPEPKMIHKAGAHDALPF